MRDFLEKYLLIQNQFPNKAGKLAQLLEAQKRLILKLSRQNHSEDVRSLLALVAESYDVSTDLLSWNKEVLQGVLNDAEHLADGARYRNTIKMQSDIITEYMSK
jgi:hypothetical protein